MKITEKYHAVIKDLEALKDYPWEDPNFYAAWLCQSYYYSSITCQVLLMGAAHCSPQQSGLQRRMAKHSTEERGHELLAERDLKDLGFDPADIGEFAVTTALYAIQIYKIQNKSVEPIMGWVLPLEGIAMEYGAYIRDRVTSANLPTRFVDIHVDEDPDHVESAFKTIESLNPEMQADTIKNMDLTRDLYLKILDECKKFAAKRANLPHRQAS